MDLATLLQPRAEAARGHSDGEDLEGLYKKGTLSIKVIERFFILPPTK